MIIKWLIRLAFPALGLLLTLIFFGINDTDGQAKTSDKTPELAETIPSFEGVVSTPVPEKGPDIVFKWQDRQGNWHYADKPPKQGAWNALAVEPANQGLDTSASNGSFDDDWSSPYAAPFSLDTNTPRNDS
ncbi:DUF4124 domain-containing protein [Marinobacter changyiensis]|uniref:DUF4124 domain-containing protein n=1 Tax=Marinobacter changyiensis TaxID=2604091 RepID=UPI001264FA51|nr:DUF4124 domain-containing protein [Marinobacter changyiensis]